MLFVLLMFAGLALGEGANEDARTLPVGVWRGGSAYESGGDSYNELGVRYICTVVPVGNDRYIARWEGSYVIPPDYSRMTAYSGEIVKSTDGGYECVGMAYYNKSGTFPPETLPEVWAIHGRLNMVDQDTLEFTWDAFAAYDWHSEPFIDPPLFEPVPTPIVEVYKRFNVKAD